MTDEAIFKALADVNRRILLDSLRGNDGQTLGELQAQLSMTRFGCMKHLRVLEDAGLVVSRRRGREKHHFLNPVPIQRVYERWVSQYARPWAGAMNLLKDNLERDMSQSAMMEIFIRTSPERLWQALTDGALVQQYYLGSTLKSDWKVGSRMDYFFPNNELMLTGEIIEIDPPRKLKSTFTPMWGEAAGKHTSTVTYEIAAVDAQNCRLTLTHDGIDPESELGKGVRTGWAKILSGLKSVLETGKSMELAAM